ncbi:MAG: DUF4124 domain-containing protein [Alphaproteobacteria bacterium]|nr:DUF4124 domain-containing protein [Alphaproteobacteria bacterium]
MPVVSVRAAFLAAAVCLAASTVNAASAAATADGASEFVWPSGAAYSYYDHSNPYAAHAATAQPTASTTYAPAQTTSTYTYPSYKPFNASATSAPAQANRAYAYPSYAPYSVYSSYTPYAAYLANSRAASNEPALPAKSASAPSSTSHPTAIASATSTTSKTTTASPSLSTGPDLTSYPRFTPTSFWYTPLPAHPPLNPNSAAYVKEFISQLSYSSGRAWINTTAYSSPIYAAPAGAPRITVTPWDCHNTGHIDSGLAAQFASVPMPSYAQPADGTDEEMTIFQPSTNTMWEFWKAQNVSGKWQACWGGQMQGVAQSNGIWPGRYGATATGLPFAGGELSIAELQQGAIRHVVGISLVNVETWKIFSWPAQRSDGYNPNNLPNRIPEGLRFRIDPSVNLDLIPMHPVARMIAKAGQQYGFVVWDKAGAISFRAENPKRYTLVGLPNPLIPLWNGTPTYMIMANVPWNKLQFLPMNYGKPAQ